MEFGKVSGREKVLGKRKQRGELKDGESDSENKTDKSRRSLVNMSNTFCQNYGAFTIYDAIKSESLLYPFRFTPKSFEEANNMVHYVLAFSTSYEITLELYHSIEITLTPANILETCEKQIFIDISNIINLASSSGSDSISSNKVKCYHEHFSNIFDGIPDNHTLESLIIDGLELGVVSARSLSKALSKFKSLKTLRLIGNKLYDDAIACLANGLKGNTSILHLRIVFCRFGDKGIEYLSSALASNTSITNIEINHSKFSDQGARHIADMLRKKKNIMNLDLASNRMGDQGVCSIARSISKNHTITSIHLFCNELTDTAKDIFLEAISRNPNIISINLGMKKPESMQSSKLRLRKQFAIYYFGHVKKMFNGNPWSIFRQHSSYITAEKLNSFNMPEFIKSLEPLPFESFFSAQLYHFLLSLIDKKFSYVV